MTTLADAWAWYRAVADGATRLAHLSKHWDAIPWGSDDEWVKGLQNDNALRHVEAPQLSGGAETIKEWLDDLAVLLLFSVFEANIRELIESQVRPEVDRLRHVALKSAGEDVLHAIAEGSFYRVLEPLKSPQTHDLIEQVNQIRRYRNWVAHGRRSDRPPDAMVIPKDAYNRLSALLEALSPPS